MKTIKDKLNLLIIKYKEKIFKIFLLMCLNLFIFLVFYICALQVLQAETKQPDINKNSRLTELNAKLNELNASITAISNDTPAKQENTIDKSKDINNTEIKSVKKEIDKPVTNAAKDKPEEKAIDNKQDKISDEAYAAEKNKADWIIVTIERGIHKDRKSAINQILTIKDKSIKQSLGEKLIEVIKNEADLEVKVKAITVIGEIKVNKALPTLITLLNNEPDDVTVASVYAIKRIGDSSAKTDLIAKLKQQKLDNNTNLTEALIDTLGDFKAAELSAYATEAIKSTKTHQIIRELFVLFLGRIESKEPKNILLELLNDEDENEQIRAFAANSLANLKITEAIPDIEKVVQTIDSYQFSKKKKYNNLYVYCVSSLVKLGYEKSFPLFLNMLRSDNAVVRLKAISLIKDTKDKRTIDILKYKMLYDPSPKVQSAAKGALKELGIDAESVKQEKLNAEQNKKFIPNSEDNNKDSANDNLNEE